MTLAFDVQLRDNYMYIYDVSSIDATLQYDVTPVKLDIYYGTLTTPLSIDVIDYLTNDRESFEIAKISPSQLSMASFKDGFYRIVYTFGNLSKENKFIIFAGIETEYNRLLVSLDAEVTVNTYSMQYTNKEVSGKVEQLAIVRSILDQLMLTTDVTNADRLIGKANRLLEIINN